MNTVEQLEYLVEIAEQLGYQVRYDYFGGTGGGACEFSGRKHLFLDLALSSVEQLEVIQSALALEPLVSTLPIPDSIKQNLIKRAA